MKKITQPFGIVFHKLDGRFYCLRRLRLEMHWMLLIFDFKTNFGLNCKYHYLNQIIKLTNKSGN
jgi:hypothetical protein